MFVAKVINALIQQHRAGKMELAACQCRHDSVLISGQDRRTKWENDSKQERHNINLWMMVGRTAAAIPQCHFHSQCVYRQQQWTFMGTEVIFSALLSLVSQPF